MVWVWNDFIDGSRCEFLQVTVPVDNVLFAAF